MPPPDASAADTDVKSPPPPPPRPRMGNNYASTASPITSARRPTTKKINEHATPRKTPVAPPGASAAHTPATTPARASRGAEDSALSPMHHVRPVPPDSHHVHPPATPTDGARALKLSIDDSSTAMAQDGTGGEHGSLNGGATADGESPSSASWVGRKVDAIFSPVLNFLQASGSHGSKDEAEEEAEALGSLTRTEDSEDTVSGAAPMAKSEGQEANDGSITDATTGEHKEESCYSDDVPKDHAEGGLDHVDADGDVTMADGSKYTSNPDVENQDATADQRHVPASEESDAEELGEEEFDPYLFIKCLPPYRHAVPPGWTARPKALPPRYVGVPPICLVLDLDETLVHCTVEPVADADMVFPVEFNGCEYQVHVRCRPFLKEFLEAVARKFEVVIFTASQQVYADKLLDMIDPEGKLIRHRLFRDSCLPVEGNFLKDLTVLGRDLARAVLVDNSPHAFGYQVDNGIPIESWFDDPHDKELLKLELFLRTLHGAEDVRDVVRATFKTHQLVLDA